MIIDQVLQDRIQELVYMGFTDDGYGNYNSPHHMNITYAKHHIQSFDAEQWVEELDYLYQALRGSGE